MRVYIPKSAKLPDELAMQVIWLVRDYKRLKAEYDNAIGNSPAPSDGQPRGSNISDITAREAIKRAEIFKKIDAIEKAKMEIPEKYRDGVWKKMVYGAPYPNTAGKATYWRYRNNFMMSIAERLSWI